ncbi:hypothetical protein [Bradyrhizobium sp.]|uniref:hypothetical protein n=1 Tax=Bradyrhizobium sp. TaxID=376 RepID=UPI0025BF3D2D|nr:hypothetical protein [Bradyrhizobium sp.]
MANNRFGFWRVALWKGDRGAAGWGRFQPPAVLEQPMRQSWSSELDDDDFPHEPIMGARLAGFWCGMSRNYGLLCRFSAAEAAASAGSSSPESRRAKKASHGIMISDEY